MPPPAERRIMSATALQHDYPQTLFERMSDARRRTEGCFPLGRESAEKIPPLPTRLAVKLARVLSRLALLSLAVAALVGLTAIYGRSGQPHLPGPNSQAARLHRPSAPQLSKFPEFFGDGMILALFALAGRIVFRLRLSPVSRSEGQPVFWNLHRETPGPQSKREPEVGP